MALLSAGQGFCDSALHVPSGVLGSESDDDPTEFDECVVAANVLVEPPPVDAVVRPFVLERDLEVLVSQIDLGDQNPVFVVDRDLRLRSRESRLG